MAVLTNSDESNVVEMPRKEHTLNGNCEYGRWSCAECGEEENCDICHEHYQLRMMCVDCEECPVCLLDGIYDESR